MKYVMWILMLCAPAGAVPCPTAQSKDAAALVEMEKSWARALDEHNAQALNCILAEEFEDADIQGQLISRTATLAKVGRSGAVHHELSDLHARVHGDFAYIRGVADAVDSKSKGVRVRFTDIYVFRERRWQCVAGQESLVPQSR